MADGTQGLKTALRYARLSAFFMAVALVAVILITIRGCNNQQLQLTQYEQMLKDSRDSTRSFTNKLEEEVYTRKIVEGSRNNLVNLLGRTIEGDRDSLSALARRFNTSVNKLNSFTQLSSSTVTDVPLMDQETVYVTPASDFITGDSCPRVRYMTGTFVGAYDSSVVRLGDSAFNRIYSKDTLDMVSLREKIKGKWYNTMNVTGRKPGAVYKIEGSYRVVDPKPARWVIVGFCGAGYNLFNFSSLKKPVPVVGIGVARVLFRIR